MRLKDLLQPINEAPLPDGGERFSPEQAAFDEDIFKKQISYAKRMKYVEERAKKIGKGSSRSAFEIMYNGRKTVLKVAHNKKGAAQNEVEVGILEDNYAQQIGIVVPIIDYDEKNDPPAWIHVEYAEKTTEPKLCKIMKCGKLDYLISAVKDNAGMKTFWKYDNVINEIRQKFRYDDDDIEIFEEYVGAITDLVTSFDLLPADFGRAANWGIFDGKPVIIDAGFNSEIMLTHYSR